MVTVYMVLHPMERTAPDVTIQTGGLLPHLLTLTCPEGRGGCFLLRLPTLTGNFRLGSMLPFGARTFLYAHRHSGRTTYCLICKCIYLYITKQEIPYYNYACTWVLRDILQ